jgi:hypothetical protein
VYSMLYAKLLEEDFRSGFLGHVKLGIGA